MFFSKSGFYNFHYVYFPYNHGSPRYLAPGGTKFENFQKFGGGGGGKLIGFNGRIWRSPQNSFFNKNHNFLKIFAEILLKSQRRDQRKHF
jgi:hypothetical protein